MHWLHRLLNRPGPEFHAEYGRMVDRLQIERTREHQRAILTNRELNAHLELLKAEAELASQEDD